ncbi:MAG: site-specific integrase [Bifidobacterium thermophilum]|nr:site-specific integrase [Bifidobacterium thermophilum]
MSYTIRAYQVKTGRRWEVRYRKPDGTSTGKRGFQRRMDADAWAAEHVTIAKATGAYVDPTAGRAILSGLWPEWIQAKRVRLRPSSVYVLETAWRTHVAPVFGGRQVQSITGAEVQSWVNRLAGERSASIVIRAEGILSALLDMAVERRSIPANPCQGVELPRKRRKRHEYLTAKELGLVAESAGWRGPVVLTLGLCGMRYGELAGLKVGDVDLERRRLTIARSVSVVGGRAVESDTPKNGTRRTVMFPAMLGPLLARQCAGKEPTDYVFTAPGETPDRPMSAGRSAHDGWFRVALRRAGVGHEGMTVHDLRHTAASLMVRSGATVKAVQRQLGHKSAAMTLDVYADLFDDDLDVLADRMSDMLAAESVGKMWAEGAPGSTEP